MTRLLMVPVLLAGFMLLCGSTDHLHAQKPLRGKGEFYGTKGAIISNSRCLEIEVCAGHCLQGMYQATDGNPHCFATKCNDSGISYKTCSFLNGGGNSCNEDPNGSQTVNCANCTYEWCGAVVDLHCAGCDCTANAIAWNGPFLIVTCIG